MFKQTEKFLPFAHLMQSAGIPDIVTKNFEHYYNQLVEGGTGFIPEATIKPIGKLPDSKTFAEQLVSIGLAALPKTVLLKLNGGLGTGMGLDKAKSLLTIKEGLTFLDITAHQAEQSGIPLVLMNSFATQADSLTLLKQYPNLWGAIPLDFLQHKIPKISQADLSPVHWPSNPELEWCPPGHGDIYLALVTSGMLDKLLEAGYEYVFVSNADNLGAVIDKAILGYLVDNQLPFLIEVADRTEADKKGGHLAQRLSDGQLILRESAQCPESDQATFQNITYHAYFNTNNLWLNLSALKTILQSSDNTLALPMIRNSKTVDPTDARSTPVYQLETAMGSVIALFQGAQAVRVPRVRFAPVKNTNDFLAIRSDLYTLTADFRVVLNPQRTLGPIAIDLDSRYYKLITDLEARFPHGAPSLLQCEQLTIKGDFKFGRNICLQGRVKLINRSPQQIELADGVVITGTQLY